MSEDMIRQKAEAAVKCRSARLKSGLQVYCRTMPGYSTVHAMYGTAFGSIMRQFVMDGREYTVPAGTAHFVEHKMFESEDGDAFDLYAKTGASANAFTGYERTCYIFTATQGFDENLDILLGMVGKPYFTEKTIAKEQGIIAQEIKMYDDSPDWRLLTGLFRCLYAQHPIRDDIAGTVESIAALTPEMLYSCTDAYYRPENMVLSVAGNIELEAVLAACRRAGLDEEKPHHTVQSTFPQETGAIPQKEMHFAMPVNKPCFALGYREQPIERGDTKMQVMCDMLPDLICGSLTTLYRRLYDDAMVNPAFSGDYVAADGCCVIAFTGESDTPREVVRLLKQEIERLRAEGVDEEVFRLVKNQIYGEILADLESAEDAAENIGAAHLKGHTLQDEIEALAALTTQQINAALQGMLLDENSAYVEIEPQV